MGIKKIKAKGKSCGLRQFEYGVPPTEIQDTTRDICDKHGFCMMTVDYFMNSEGLYVNEMQTIFGYSRPYICIVKEEPGRFVYLDRKWTFEAGEFNSNESYELRLEAVLNKYGGES